MDREMRRALIIVMASSVIVLSIWGLLSYSRPSQLPALISRQSAEPMPIKIARGADASDIVMTPQHELLRVEHKNAQGQKPLEIVQTPSGPVTIQRTFKTDGTVVKEEAFRDGKPVPFPP
jgi:hypothetical protein